MLIMLVNPHICVIARFIFSSVYNCFPKKYAVDWRIPSEPIVIIKDGYTVNAAIIPLFSGPRYRAVIIELTMLTIITAPFDIMTRVRSPTSDPSFICLKFYRVYQPPSFLPVHQYLPLNLRLLWPPVLS